MLGYNKIILKSDGEPAIMSLKEAVQAESSCKIVVTGSLGSKEENTQIIKEESPACDSISNGYIDCAIKQMYLQVCVFYEFHGLRGLAHKCIRFHVDSSLSCAKLLESKL